MLFEVGAALVKLRVPAQLGQLGEPGVLQLGDGRATPGAHRLGEFVGAALGLFESGAQLVALVRGGGDGLGQPLVRQGGVRAGRPLLDTAALGLLGPLACRWRGGGSGGGSGRSGSGKGLRVADL